MSKPITLIVSIFMLAMGSMLAGCNTSAGLGKDIQAAGGALSSEAKEQKGY